MHNKLTKTIITYFDSRQEVVAVYLFGSHASGKEHRSSDIDIGVLLNRNDRAGERRNKFLVDLSIDADMSSPASSDNLKDAINYQLAYRLVKEEMEKKSKLLENIAKRILDIIYENFEGIREVTVKISKMNPPMGGGRIEKVSVTLTR